MSERDVPEANGAVADERLTDKEPDVVDDVAKLELLRQMEDIERLRE